MLPRSKRLTTRLFRDTFAKGRIAHTPLFTLKMNRDESSITNRFAISVPKKVAPTAVERNKVRRRIYSVIRSLIKESKTKDIDCVIVTKPEILKTSIESIKEQLKNVFVKYGILE